MDPSNQYEISDGREPYAWMRHAALNGVPADQFPTTSGPIVYEGYVPQQFQQTQSSDSRQLHQGFSTQYPPILEYNQSQYPPLDQYESDQHLSGGPVRPLAGTPGRYVGNTHRVTPAIDPLLSRPQITQYAFDETDIDEMSIDEGDDPALASGMEGHISDALSRKTGRGRGRSRRAGGEKGPGRRKQREKERGGWNRGTRTGLRPVLDPGEEFNTLHKDATEAFIEQQDFDRALELILKAISINPEIYSAHVLLSEIYFARNDDERGLAALFSGAHASPNDPEVWQQLADVCLQRASTDRYNMLKQASYCFQRLLQIDKSDHDARFQKAAISRELGHHTKALKDLEYLLQKMPYNSSILRQIAEVCLDVNDVGKAIGLYDDALEYHRLNGALDEDAFTWADLIVYVDLIARSNGVPKAIQVLKNTSRWLLGRENETCWEEFMSDDREWDAEDTPRRAQVPQYRSNSYPLDRYGTGLPLEIRVKLGDFRLRNGDRQEALNHFEWLAPDDRDGDAPLSEYSDLFLQVADALREVKEFQQALRYYEALNSINACDDIEFWLGFGACSYVCEKKEQALFCYEVAKDTDPTSGEARTQLSKLYAAKGDREKALMLARSAIIIYESQIPKTHRRKYERKDIREAREDAQNAYKEAYRLIKPGEAQDDMPKPHFSRRAREKARRLAKEAVEKSAEKAVEVGNEQEQQEQHEQQEQQEEQEEQNDRDHSPTPPQRADGLRSREEAVKSMNKKKIQKKEKNTQDRYNQIQQLYSTLNSVTEAMRNGDDVARNVWMDCAEALVAEFRTEKAFYPAERYIKFQGFDRPPKKPNQNVSTGSPEELGADMPFPSIESSIPNDYCGMSFADWLETFLEYAILLANMQETTTDCYAVINAALDCNVWYHNPEAVVQIYTCWLACALALRDETTLFNTVIRWFMREFVFCTDTYRLFGALNLYFPLPNDKGGKNGQLNNAVFRQGPNQKYLFRQLMGIDANLPEGYGADHPDGPVPEFMRRPHPGVQYMSDRLQRHIAESGSNSRSIAHTGTADLDGEQTPPPISPRGLDSDLSHRTFMPKELDVVLLTLYAQTLYAGNSFPNALSYFYRAYTLEPKNPILLFSIALCYMHQMLKRQNENRHMYLLQGWSFFEDYVEARIEWAEKKEREGWAGLVVVVKREIEFNRARCWQMLGMNDLAVRSYAKMLDMKVVKDETEMDTDTSDAFKETYSMEAAYAMMSIYALNGDMDTAKEITDRYLVVE